MICAVGGATETPYRAAILDGCQLVLQPAKLDHNCGHCCRNLFSFCDCALFWMVNGFWALRPAVLRLASRLSGHHRVRAVQAQLWRCVGCYFDDFIWTLFVCGSAAGHDLELADRAQRRSDLRQSGNDHQHRAAESAQTKARPAVQVCQPCLGLKS